MSDPTLARILRESRLAETLQPAHMLRQQEATARVIDETGAIDPRAAAPFRTPLTMHWGPSSTARQRVARAGNVSILAAHAGTAPSTGDAVVTLTQATLASGVETLLALTIPEGEQFANVTAVIPVPAGAWMGATVTTANGASGVSISLTIQQGSAT